MVTVGIYKVTKRKTKTNSSWNCTLITILKGRKNWITEIKKYSLLNCLMEISIYFYCLRLKAFNFDVGICRSCVMRNNTVRELRLNQTRIKYLQNLILSQKRRPTRGCNTKKMVHFIFDFDFDWLISLPRCNFTLLICTTTVQDPKSTNKNHCGHHQCTNLCCTARTLCATALLGRNWITQ